jgi:predicted dienelactone hydrolase
VLDAIALERRGIPAAAVGVDKLVETTGRGMCRAQGLPDYPIAVISHPTGSLASVQDAGTLDKYAAQVAEQVARILTGARS